MPNTETELERLAAIESALRRAFPHFADPAPITPETILQVGREWEDMVLNWEPQLSEIDFLDSEGNEGKITRDDGLWGFDGQIKIDATETP